jgi:hypothetical protein
MQRSMKSRSAALIAGIAFTFAVFTALLPASPASAQTAKEAAARALILETWTTSHASDLTAEARRYLHTVAAPIIRDYVSGKLKMPLAQESPFRELLSEAFDFVLLLEKASSEFEVTIDKYHDEFVDDIARVVAKHLTDDEIQTLRDALKLTATQKGFDALYKFYRIGFSFTYEEELANQHINIWAQEIFLQYVRRGWQLDRSPPTPERISKATQIVNDLMAGLHLDQMVVDGLRFGREVVIPLLPSENDRTEARARLDDAEKKYHTWKPAGWVAAYTGLAMALNEEQLTALLMHVRGPGMTKMFKLLFEAEQAATSLTLADLEAAKTFMEDRRLKGVFRDRSAEEKAAANADIQALGEKWGPRLAASITPETRDALIQSAIKLWGLANTPGLFPPGIKAPGQQL